MMSVNLTSGASIPTALPQPSTSAVAPTKNKWCHPFVGRWLAALLLLTGLLALNGCKKDTLPPTQPNESQMAALLQVPNDASDALLSTTAHLRQQLQRHDYSTDFVRRHGLPLWGKALQMVSDTNNFMLYVPLQLPGQSELSGFVAVRCHKGQFGYRLFGKAAVEAGTTGLPRWQPAFWLAQLEAKVSGRPVRLAHLWPGALAKARGQGEQEGYFAVIEVDAQLIVQASCCIAIWDDLDGNPGNGNEYYLYHDCSGCGIYSLEGVGDWLNGLGGDAGGGDGGTGGGGGSGVGNTGITPCAHADSLAKNSEYKAKFNELKSKTSSNREHGFFYRENDGNSINEVPIEGLPDSASINFSVPAPIDGFMHSHYTGLLSVFSVDDLNAMAKLYQYGNMMNPVTFTVGVVTASGTQYLLKIEDETKFAQFAASLLADEESKNFAQLYKDIYGIKQTNTADKNEKAFLWFLKQANTGLRLFKGNADFSSWTPLKVDPNGDIVNNPC